MMYGLPPLSIFVPSLPAFHDSGFDEVLKLLGVPLRPTISKTMMYWPLAILVTTGMPGRSARSAIATSSTTGPQVIPFAELW